MVEGSLAIIKIGNKTRYGVYRGKYSEFYGKNGAVYSQTFAGEDPLVFTEQIREGKWITRHYFFKNDEVYIEWLT
jgi:hypothetical protein